MREWIEEQEHKRAVELLAQEFEVGDLVQGMGNFSDVWFEILRICRYDEGGNMPARYSSVTFVTYSKYGNERWTDHIRFGDVRKVAKQIEVNPRQCRVSLKGKLIRWGEVIEWPNEEPKGYGNRPERHPDAEALLAKGRK